MALQLKYKAIENRELRVLLNRCMKDKNWREEEFTSSLKRHHSELE